jgi:hypothetical protein
MVWCKVPLFGSQVKKPMDILGKTHVLFVATRARAVRENPREITERKFTHLHIDNIISFCSVLS